MDTGTYISLGLLIPIAAIIVGMINNRVKSASKQAAIDAKLESELGFMNERLTESKKVTSDKIEEYKAMYEQSNVSIKNELGNVRSDVSEVKTEVKGVRSDISRLEGGLNTLINFRKNKE